MHRPRFPPPHHPQAVRANMPFDQFPSDWPYWIGTGNYRRPFVPPHMRNRIRSMPVAGIPIRPPSMRYPAPRMNYPQDYGQNTYSEDQGADFDPCQNAYEPEDYTSTGHGLRENFEAGKFDLVPGQRSMPPSEQFEAYSRPIGHPSDRYISPEDSSSRQGPSRPSFEQTRHDTGLASASRPHLPQPEELPAPSRPLRPVPEPPRPAAAIYAADGAVEGDEGEEPEVVRETSTEPTLEPTSNRRPNIMLMPKPRPDFRLPQNSGPGSRPGPSSMQTIAPKVGPRGPLDYDPYSMNAIKDYTYKNNQRINDPLPTPLKIGKKQKKQLRKQLLKEKRNKKNNVENLAPYNKEMRQLIAKNIAGTIQDPKMLRKLQEFRVYGVPKTKEMFAEAVEKFGVSDHDLIDSTWHALIEEAKRLSLTYWKAHLPTDLEARKTIVQNILSENRAPQRIREILESMVRGNNIPHTKDTFARALRKVKDDAAIEDVWNELMFEAEKSLVQIGNSE